MTQLYSTTELQAIYIGIDVSKLKLDVHIHPLGKAKSFGNNKKGIVALDRFLRKWPITQIAMEATGRYHLELLRYLNQCGYNVALLSPQRTRRFADAIGLQAKTDGIDAKLIALYSAKVEPDSHNQFDDQLYEIKELMSARRALIKRMNQITNHAQEVQSKILRRQFDQARAQCKRHLAQIDKEISEKVESSPDLCRRRAILMSIPGVGAVTAFTLLADMPELGVVSVKQIASLVGVAPLARDSGSWSGKRFIRGGRYNVRKALYMAAVASLKANRDMALFYKRLKALGKPTKVALVAVMRKLAILANTLITENRMWAENRP